MWPACSLGGGADTWLQGEDAGNTEPSNGGREKKGLVTQSPDGITSLPFLLLNLGKLGIASRAFGKKSESNISSQALRKDWFRKKEINWLARNEKPRTPRHIMVLLSKE